MTSSTKQSEVRPDSQNTHRKESRHKVFRDFTASFVALMVFVSASFLLRTSLSGKPFVLIFLVGFLCTAVCCCCTQSRWLRKPQISVATSFLCLFLLEVGLIAAGRFGVGPCSCREAGGYSRLTYYDGTTDLGYQAVPGARVNSRKICGTRELYDVVYTIDEYGQRVTRGNPAGATILFFGCSFTFGEGVQDDESLPAVTSRLLDYRYNVVNFGFHGWGPHQMLRILETRREENRVTGGLNHVVYIAIPGHVQRCVGGAAWDQSGPRYELKPSDGVSWRGPFRSGTSTFVSRLMRQSECGEFLVRRFHADSLPKPRDYEVFAEIVAASARIVKDRYAAPFRVLVWNDTISPVDRNDLLDALRAKELSVIDAAEFVTSDQRDKLTIAPGLDGHPNRLAYERVAPALISKIFPDLDQTE